MSVFKLFKQTPLIRLILKSRTKPKEQKETCQSHLNTCLTLHQSSMIHWFKVQIFLYLATAAATEMYTTKFTTFPSDITVKMTSVGPTMPASTFLSCARRCMKYVTTCSSFLYNQTINTCIPGSWLVRSEMSVTSTLATLYYKPGAFCESRLVNFTIKSYGDVSACMWLSNSSANYDTARKYCLNLGSHLYTIRIPNKLFILLDVVHTLNVDYWVGLNDIAEEGVFRWEDDNSLWKKDWTLFASGQPDNLGNEDCVQYSPTFYPINDRPCSYLSRFICEMSPLLS
nr:CD209 antigen-like protein 2 [Biomphalaria glabrata]